MDRTKNIEDFELESFPTRAEHSQMVKGARIGNDYRSKDCAFWPALIAFFRFKILYCPLFLFATCCPIEQFHDSTYKAGWDIHFSPYAGGEDVLFAHRIVERAEGYLV